MPKKSTKKKQKKVPQKKSHLITKKTPQKRKLSAGKKQCKGCSTVMPIHRKVCHECGYVHEMRNRKENIMKKLNKMTPVLVKSIIQNDDFNQFRGWDEGVYFNLGSLVKEKDREEGLGRRSSEREEKNVKGIGRRRSQAPKSQQQEPQQSSSGFKPTNNKHFHFRKFANPISSIASSKNWLVIGESLTKTPVSLPEKESLTVQAYKLHNFTLVGLDYIGSTLIHFCYTPPQSTDIGGYEFSRVKIGRCVLEMRVFGNLLGLLCGDGRVCVLGLPEGKKNGGGHGYTLEKSIDIMEVLPDRITCFQFLRSTVKNIPSANQQQLSPPILNTSPHKKSPEILIAVGSLFGRLSIYRLTTEGYSLVRYFPTAHLEMITTISECSLNNGEEVLFATGSYDGTVSVWGLWEDGAIFSYQCSNRKIWSIHWDPGAKYLFINRDQLSQTCIILCFYAINKIEQYIHLSPTVQIRTVKTRFHTTIVSHNYYSKCLPVLDPVSGMLKIVQMEELRGNSLKKKKLKRSQGDRRYYRIGLRDREEGNGGGEVEIQEIQEGDDRVDECLTVQKLEKGQTKKFPIFSGLSIQSKNNMDILYISAYNGTLITFKNPTKAQQ